MVSRGTSASQAVITEAYRRDNVYLEASIYEFLPGAEPFVAAARGLIQDRVVYASAFPFNTLDTIDRFRGLGFDPDVLDKLVYGNAARDAVVTVTGKVLGRARRRHRDAVL